MKTNGKNDLTFGYGYDFSLYCVGQEEIPAEELCSEKLLCRTSPYAAFDSSAFPYSDGPGVFCDFISTAGECGGTVFLKEASEQAGSNFPVSWRTEAEQKDVKRMVIEEEYKDELVRAVYAVLDKSPVRKVYLQVRCQCRDKNNLIGILTGQQMEAIIREDRLLGNIVYVINE